MGETYPDPLLLRGVSKPSGLMSSIDTFNQLGAIRFDRDLRSMMTNLSSQTMFGDIREKFIRLQQISSLLNLDSVCQVRFC